MGTKEIKTSDGVKLVDTKTSKLKGSLPKKVKAPTPAFMPIGLRDDIGRPKDALDVAVDEHNKKIRDSANDSHAVLNETSPAIDSAYRNFKANMPVATRHGIDVAKLEAAQRKYSTIWELVFAINDDPYGLGLSHKAWVAMMTRAYNQYLEEHGPIVESSPAVLDVIQGYIGELIGNQENYVLPEQTDAEVVFGYLQELQTFDVDVEDVNPEVSEATLKEAFESLEESVSNYKTSPVPPGSRDFDPSESEGLASDAFESLGFSSKDAYRKSEELFSKVSWEPF